MNIPRFNIPLADIKRGDVILFERRYCEVIGIDSFKGSPNRRLHFKYLFEGTAVISSKVFKGGSMVECVQT